MIEAGPTNISSGALLFEIRVNAPPSRPTEETSLFRILLESPEYNECAKVGHHTHTLLVGVTQEQFLTLERVEIKVHAALAMLCLPAAMGIEKLLVFSPHWRCDTYLIPVPAGHNHDDSDDDSDSVDNVQDLVWDWREWFLDYLRSGTYLQCHALQGASPG